MGLYGRLVVEDSSGTRLESPLSERPSDLAVFHLAASGFFTCITIYEINRVGGDDLVLSLHGGLMARFVAQRYQQYLDEKS